MAIDAFMWFQSYDGRYLESESQVDLAKDPHISAVLYPPNANIFEVEDYSFDIAQTLNIGSQSTGAGAGKVTFNPFRITRKTDKAFSPSFSDGVQRYALPDRRSGSSQIDRRFDRGHGVSQVHLQAGGRQDHFLGTLGRVAERIRDLRVWCFGRRILAAKTRRLHGNEGRRWLEPDQKHRGPRPRRHHQVTCSAE